MNDFERILTRGEKHWYRAYCQANNDRRRLISEKFESETSILNRWYQHAVKGAWLGLFTGFWLGVLTTLLAVFVF